MNPYISIDKWLIEEDIRNNIEELAEANGVTYEVMDIYLSMMKGDEIDQSRAKKYLEMKKKEMEEDSE